MLTDSPYSPVRRVVLVVLDGLRPDAVQRFHLPNLSRLAMCGASTFEARTVVPSVTACAMATLLTGASPERHGLRCDRFHLPRPTGALHPLARELGRAGLPTSGFMAELPFLMRPVGGRLASALGIAEPRFAGDSSLEILLSARRALEEQRRGLIILHWPDGDRAGHSDGWMSPAYGRAAERMDESLGRLCKMVDLADPETLLIALADHGGGGTEYKDHDSDHPLNRTIPIVLAGGAVIPGSLGSGVSIGDVPATILWSLGVPQPESYCGSPLTQAFSPLRAAA